MRRLFAVALFSLACFGLTAVADEPPKALKDAIASLEKAVTTTKDKAQKDQLNEAIKALKRIANPPKVMNEFVSDFLDNPGKYRNKTVTFVLTFADTSKDANLQDYPGSGKAALFATKDPKNGAFLVVGIEIRRDVKVPKAKTGDNLLVTFNCTRGDTDKGNVAVSIERTDAEQKAEPKP